MVYIYIYVKWTLYFYDDENEKKKEEEKKKKGLTFYITMLGDVYSI